MFSRELFVYLEMIPFVPTYSSLQAVIVPHYGIRSHVLRIDESMTYFIALDLLLVPALVNVINPTLIFDGLFIYQDAVLHLASNC